MYFILTQLIFGIIVEIFLFIESNRISHVVRNEQMAIMFDCCLEGNFFASSEEKLYPVTFMYGYVLE